MLCEQLSDMMDDPNYNYGKPLSGYFNEAVYLQNKADAMNAYGATNSWTAEKVADAFVAAGLTAWEHFHLYGAYERNEYGEIGIDPSETFDTSLYYDSKRLLMSWNNEYVTIDELAAIFKNAGLDPVTHYEQYGKSERLIPQDAQEYSSNRMVYYQGNFSEAEYISNKTAAMRAQGYAWSETGVLKAILDAGMTPLGHYHKYGAYERNADGEMGIDPSSNFDTSIYYQNKLTQLAANGESMSLNQLISVLQQADLDPLLHYAAYGIVEGVSGQEVQTMGVNYLDDAGPGA